MHHRFVVGQIKKRLQKRNKKFLKSGEIGVFMIFCKGYSKAKWSKMADFWAQLQSIKKKGKTACTII